MIFWGGGGIDPYRKPAKDLITLNWDKMLLSHCTNCYNVTIDRQTHEKNGSEIFSPLCINPMLLFQMNT